MNSFRMNVRDAQIKILELTNPEEIRSFCRKSDIFILP